MSREDVAVFADDIVLSFIQWSNKIHNLRDIVGRDRGTASVNSTECRRRFEPAYVALVSQFDFDVVVVIEIATNIFFLGIVPYATDRCMHVAPQPGNALQWQVYEYICEAGGALEL